MFKKLTWALLEVATMGYGTYLFVSTIVNEDDLDPHQAGLGAFMIVLGLLLRNWRMSLFVKEDKTGMDKPVKSETQSKAVNTLLILVISLTVFMLNRKVNHITSAVIDNAIEIENFDSK